MGCFLIPNPDVFTNPFPKLADGVIPPADSSTFCLNFSESIFPPLPNKPEKIPFIDIVIVPAMGFWNFSFKLPQAPLSPPIFSSVSSRFLFVFFVVELDVFCILPIELKAPKLNSTHFFLFEDKLDRSSLLFSRSEEHTSELQSRGHLV